MKPLKEIVEITRAAFKRKDFALAQGLEYGLITNIGKRLAVKGRGRNITIRAKKIVERLFKEQK